MKYRTAVSSLVTKMMTRTYVIKANSEFEAKKKAESRFRKACKNAKTYIDCGDTVVVDSCDPVDEVTPDG